MIPGCAFLEGRFVPMSEAKISVLDWGFLRSDATYDVVHVWRGKFFRLDRHIERFHQSMRNLRLQAPYDREAIARILAECVRRSGLGDAYVEMITTRGLSPTSAAIRARRSILSSPLRSLLAGSSGPKIGTGRAFGCKSGPTHRARER